MKKMTRRDFLKWSVAASGALALNTSQIHSDILENDNAPILWLQGAGCTGCSISTLNVSNPATIDIVLLSAVSMKFNNTVMALSGEQAMASLKEAAERYKGEFILVIEGAVPTRDNGNYCIIGEENGNYLTMLQAVRQYGPLARYVVSTGTCASFGGMAAAPPNDSESVPVIQALTNPVNQVINLPGCPVHPTVVIQTLIDIVTSGMPMLDNENRPVKFYSETVHDSCNPDRCFWSEGCKGPDTLNVCSSLMWNKTLCTYPGYPCIGCASPDFPTNPLIDSIVSEEG
ncbi:MAG: twin-arginine translocation signal domain-containing protein [Spirochaetales bacterium]|nr:twin-arginine translocation signal domain-containing protein [Spirochaetales bacterium]